MKRLTVKLLEIHCKDPQDPRRDELYFITATNNNSTVTKDIRKIKHGEKRAFQDDSAIVEQLEAIASMGINIVRRNIETRMVNETELYKQIIRLLMENVTNLFKYVFKDSSLGHKVIPIAFSEETEYPVEYVVSLKSSKSPTYEYEIRLEVTIS